MEPVEARIGNYVLIPPTNSKVLIPSVPRKIKGITTSGEFEFDGDHFETTIRIPARHCKGIQLSPEHLEFLGFIRTADFQYFHKVLEIKLDDFKEFFIWSIHKNLNVRIESVHHLQNLFSDITSFSYIPDFKSFYQKFIEA